MKSNPRWTRGGLVCTALLIALCGIAQATPAFAVSEAIVTQCDQDGPNGVGYSLAEALTSGASLITFNCPDGASLFVSTEHTIPLAVERIDARNHGRSLFLVNAITGPVPQIPYAFSVVEDANLEIVGLQLAAGVANPQGGIESQGNLRIVGSRFTSLYDAVSGDRGVLEIRGSRFEGNIHGVSFSLALTRGVIASSIFLNNMIGVGGAQGPFPVVQDNLLLVATSSFGGNRVAIQHCAGDDCTQLRPLTVVNSLLARGSDSNEPGMAVNGRGIVLVNSTVIDNEGVALNGQGDGAITLLNTIVANRRGNNCQGGVVSVGPNLQWPDASCAGVAVAAPRLSAILEPLAGSPALGGGDLTACTTAPVNATDLYGQMRPRGQGCSIGAVEGKLDQPPVIPDNRPQDERHSG